MEDIITGHDLVSDLVVNGRVHLFRIDDDGNALRRHAAGKWLAGNTQSGVVNNYFRVDDQVVCYE